MSEEEDIHPIFLKDPEELMQYVYKKVIAVNIWKIRIFEKIATC